MPPPIVVPKATISMSQGTILRWAKKIGDLVARDELLLELETDKAVIELPAPADGTLLRITRDSGEVAVDLVIGWIGTPGEPIPDQNPASPKVDRSIPVHQEVATTPAIPPLAATPAARRRAKELGIDIRGVKGSGPEPGNRITEQDVESHVANNSDSVVSSRRMLAEHVTHAWQTVPHIHIVRLMDVEALVKAKEVLSTDPNPIGYTDLVLSTVAKTLMQFPQLRFSATPEKTASISLAFAVDTENGVVAPMIQEANLLSLAELSRMRRKLTSLALSRKLRPEHLQTANFTVTNLGMLGVDLFTPIINTPQVAILATGQLKQQAIVEAGQIRPGWRMWATLTADHRHIDGALAANFLSAWQVEMNSLSERNR
jgi:pyruvate dehydrogenase E2 component (dihydrolipoamide acetyltransferase)